MYRHSVEQKPHERSHMIEVAEDLSGYTVISEASESLILKKHEPYGKQRGGERFAKELRNGSS